MKRTAPRGRGAPGAQFPFRQLVVVPLVTLVGFVGLALLTRYEPFADFFDVFGSVLYAVLLGVAIATLGAVVSGFAAVLRAPGLQTARHGVALLCGLLCGLGALALFLARSVV